jgi:hypothetical protein
MVRLAIFAAVFALLAGASPPARSWTVSDTWTARLARPADSGARRRFSRSRMVAR